MALLASLRRALASPQQFRAARPRLEALEPRLVLSIPTPDHIVIVIEENHGFGEIIGSPAAPYINALAKQGALFTSSYGVTHPSQPNYLALFSGSTQGVTDDNTPYYFSTGNLGKSLLNKGLTFGGYSEDLPFVGFTGDSSGGYVRKHNPWVDFTNLPPTVNLPFTSFPLDYSLLPTVAVVVPNLTHDMHDGTIQQGDSWLQAHLNSYVQWAATHNSLLIVTWDEDDFTDVNWIPTIFVGPMVSPGSYAETISHYNVLRTVEDMYGLPYLANDGNVPPISDVWVPSAATPPAPSGLAAQAVSDTEIDLHWTSNSTNETGFKVERATDSGFTQDLTLVAITPAGVTQYADTGLPASTTYYYRVRATNAGGDSGNSDPASAATLPAGWAAADIGGPGLAGSTAFDGATWTVTGGGADIWDVPDQFQYAYRSVGGDALIVAHVASVDNANGGAKAGVMFRDGTAAGAPYALVAELPNGQVEFQWRDTPGGDADWNGSLLGDPGGVKWLSLIRGGDAINAFYAATDGTPFESDWVWIGSHDVPMAGPTAGLAVTAVNNDGLTTAAFTDVGVIPLTAGPTRVGGDNAGQPRSLGGAATSAAPSAGVPNSADRTRAGTTSRHGAAYALAVQDSSGRVGGQWDDGAGGAAWGAAPGRPKWFKLTRKR
jgi:hypothetical protein